MIRITRINAVIKNGDKSTKRVDITVSNKDKLEKYRNELIELMQAESVMFYYEEIDN